MSFERRHHLQLAMPPGGEAAARAFFAGVLGFPVPGTGGYPGSFAAGRLAA